MMSEPFSLNVRLNTPVLPVMNQPRLLYVLLRIEPNRQAQLERALVNLAIVVDASDSMMIPSLDDDLVLELKRRGLLEEIIVDGIPAFHVKHIPQDIAAHANPVRNIDDVKEALHILVDRLSSSDRLSLVAFASRAQTLISNRSGKEKTKLLDILESLSEGAFGDDTRMGAGLRLAMKEAEKGVSPDHITRVILLTDGFANDEAESLAVAQELSQRGYPLSTMGLGLVFNEGLLISMAEISGGNAHLIFDSSEIADAFAAEFESTQSVLSRALDLKVALTPGVELRRVHRVQPVITELSLATLREGSFTATLGDLEKDQPVAVLLEIVVPPKPVGMYRLAQVAVAGTVPGQTQNRTIARADVVINMNSNNILPQPDAEIMNLAEKVSAFRLQTRALSDLAAGDIGGATRKLEAAATRLLSLGEHDLAATLQTEADNLAQQGQMSSAGTKKLRYETRKLTQKLS